LLTGAFVREDFEHCLDKLPCPRSWVREVRARCGHDRDGRIGVSVERWLPGEKPE